MFRTARVLCALAGLTVLTVTTSCTATQQSPAATGVQPVPVRALLPVLRLPLAGKQAFAAPLVVSAAYGQVTSVVVTGSQGPVAGTLGAAGWTSSDQLLPASHYRIAAQVADLAGATHALALTTTTAEAEHELAAVLTPGDGRVVGVGMPLTVLLNRPVADSADRRAVLARLTVTTAPAIAGSWRFMSNTEIHYRPATFWPAGTAITLTSDLSYLQLADQVTWGQVGAHTTSYRIGASMVSTVDLTAYTMTVRRAGQVLRVLKMSAGSPRYPTKGGVHIVLAKARLQLFDSATVGIPRNSADGYYKKLPWAVRISNGGAFVHAQPASVSSQGIRNVSHGCINLSPADASWFYSLSRLGDVVDVIHAVVPPVLSDPGMSDWNLAYDAWAEPAAAQTQPAQLARQ